MSGTSVVALPVNLDLPAHLQGADVAAAIAADNAAAAGGIKSGGFPRISIKANKFHEVDGGEMKTYMAVAVPGQPPLPMMCLEAVVVAANPALSRTYYAKDFTEGNVDAPDCSSVNGVTPDSHIVNKQSAVCATCPQAQWGSKISKLSGKEIMACSQSKQLVVLPAADLGYKALGLAIGPGSIGNWGKYVQALSGRNIPISSVVTNVTFDATANGILEFAFNRFLDEAQYAQAKLRALGDDVKNIVNPAQVVSAPMLAAPASMVALPPPAAAPATPAYPAGTAPVPATPAGFATPAVAHIAPPPVAADPFVGQPAHVALAVNAVGGISTPDGLATYTALTGLTWPPAVATVPAPAPAVPVVVDVFAGHPTHVKLAVNAAGGVGSPNGDATFKALTGMDVSAAQLVGGQPAAGGFGAATSATQPVAAAAPATRKRAPRQPATATPAPAAPVATPQSPAGPDLSYLDPGIRASVEAVGATSPAGQAILAQFPPPATVAAPAAQPAPPVAAPVAAPAPAPVAPAGGFGGAPATPATAPTPAMTAAGASLKDLLQKKLGIGAGATTAAAG